MNFLKRRVFENSELVARRLEFDFLTCYLRDRIDAGAKRRSDLLSTTTTGSPRTRASSTRENSRSGQPPVTLFPPDFRRPPIKSAVKKERNARSVAHPRCANGPVGSSLSSSLRDNTPTRPGRSDALSSSRSVALVPYLAPVRIYHFPENLAGKFK